MADCEGKNHTAQNRFTDFDNYNVYGNHFWFSKKYIAKGLLKMVEVLALIKRFGYIYKSLDMKTR